MKLATLSSIAKNRQSANTLSVDNVDNAPTSITQGMYIVMLSVIPFVNSINGCLSTKELIAHSMLESRVVNQPLQDLTKYFQHGLGSYACMVCIFLYQTIGGGGGEEE